MVSQQIVVIDYGMGNLHSVASALKHVTKNTDVCVTSNLDTIKNADRVILPGVGAIRDCVAEMKKISIDTIVADTISSGKPLLGICVGMQALMEYSEENGGIECLKHFAGSVDFFSSNAAFTSASHMQESNLGKLKVPHMGWNQVEQMNDHFMWKDIPNKSRFYFVHSYFVSLKDKALMSGKVNYGIDFTAAIARDNVFATQFHPEKSHSSGLQLLKNFSEWKL